MKIIIKNNLLELVLAISIIILDNKIAVPIAIRATISGISIPMLRTILKIRTRTGKISSICSSIRSIRPVIIPIMHMETITPPPVLTPRKIINPMAKLITSHTEKLTTSHTEKLVKLITIAMAKLTIKIMVKPITIHTERQITRALVKLRTKFQQNMKASEQEQPTSVKLQTQDKTKWRALPQIIWVHIHSETS